MQQVLSARQIPGFPDQRCRRDRQGRANSCCEHSQQIYSIGSTRDPIERGALKDRNRELFHLSDPVEVLILRVQGLATNWSLDGHTEEKGWQRNPRATLHWNPGRWWYLYDPILGVPASPGLRVE